MRRDDGIGMLMMHLFLFVVVVHVLSMLLWKEIFHQLHRHARDFVLIELQEFFVVYNVFDVVVVEL
jgi:hypothetical protein